MFIILSHVISHHLTHLLSYSVIRSEINFLSGHLSHVHSSILSSYHTYFIISCHLKYIHSPILASFHRSFSYILSSSHTFIFLFFHPLTSLFSSLVITSHVLLSIPILILSFLPFSYAIFSHFPTLAFACPFTTLFLVLS
jgi:hypothetical protein